MIFLLLLVVKINKNRNRQYICLQNTLPFIVFSSSQLCEVGRPNNIVMLKQRRLKGTKFSDLLKNHPSRRLFRCRASVLMIGLRILKPFDYLEIISATCFWIWFCITQNYIWYKGGIFPFFFQYFSPSILMIFFFLK